MEIIKTISVVVLGIFILLLIPYKVGRSDYYLKKYYGFGMPLIIFVTLFGLLVKFGNSNMGQFVSVPILDLLMYLILSFFLSFISLFAYSIGSARKLVSDKAEQID